MEATENARFNAKVQRIVGIYPWLDRLLSYLLAKRQWYVCKNTNHTSYLLYDHRSVMQRRRQVATAGGAPRV